MTGKRMRLVRSRTSFDDMTALDEQWSLQERRQQMKPPNHQTMLEKQHPKVPPKPSTATQGHFLEQCNYCRKRIGDKDKIYMYSTLQAFCSSECRIQQILEDKTMEMVMCGQGTESMAWHQKMYRIKMYDTEKITPDTEDW